MRTLKTKWFAKWAHKNKVSDFSLLQASAEVREGRFETSYGHGVIKKRLANKGRGKRGSVRTMIAFKKGTDCFFVYGFSKNERENISPNEEKTIKLIAAELLAHSSSMINQLVLERALIEVKHEQK